MVGGVSDKVYTNLYEDHRVITISFSKILQILLHKSNKLTLLPKKIKITNSIFIYYNVIYNKFLTLIIFFSH